MNEQNKQKHPSSRKAHLRVMAILSVVVVIVGIVALNIGMDVLEKQMPIAVDLTSDSTFTMSDNSVTLARGIGQNEQIGNTEIVVFVNEKLFTNNDYTSYPMMYELKEVAIQSAGTADGQQMYNRLLESFETVLDQFYYMLKQYQVESGGKITHRFIDVDANPALAAAYQEYEIGAGTVLFLNEDGTRSQKFELLNMISLDQQASTTEYNSDAERLVASCLNLVTAVDSKKATFLLGHGEDDTLVNTLQQFLINNACDVAALDITASKTPEEDTDVFVIAAPTVDYSAEEIALLRKWLENDGKRGRDLLVVTDPSAKLPSLYEMVGDEYGIVVTDDLVCETDSANLYNNNTLYPYGTIESTEHASAAGQRVLMPMTRALKLTVTSSTEAALYAKPIVTFADTTKVQTLADLAAGKVQIEDYKTPETTPVVGAAYTTVRQYDNDTKQWLNTDVMVFGSSVALYQNTMSLPSAVNNEAAFLDTFRGLSDLESVISISSRSLAKDTIDFGNSSTQNTLSIVFMWVLPLLMVVIGTVVFIRRRSL